MSHENKKPEEALLIFAELINGQLTMLSFKLVYILYVVYLNMFMVNHNFLRVFKCFIA